MPDIVNVYEMGNNVPWEPNPGETKCNSTTLPASSLLRAALPHHSQINFTKIPDDSWGAINLVALADETNKSLVRGNIVTAAKELIAGIAEDLSVRGLAKEASRVIILIPAPLGSTDGGEDNSMVEALIRAMTWFEALAPGIYAISEGGAFFPL